MVGEEKSRLMLFVMASTYKMPEPLHVLTQGASGSGKSHLINAIGDCFPQEDLISMTRVTSKSFYHYDADQLVNKLILLQDFDGLDEEAQFAFREMQSAKHLSCSTTQKDRFGNLRSQVKRVEAHFASIAATTRAEVYLDNMSRSVIVGIDESEEQTKRILMHQNKMTAGLIDTEKQQQAKELLRCAIRLLKPYQVINHYADKVMLPMQAKMIRRLNNQFQSLVAQVTLLHQYQREKNEQGKLKATLDDLRMAVDLFTEAIYLKVDELDPSTRQFFEQLKIYVKNQANGSTHRFSAREIRQELNSSKTQTFRFLETLKTLEYIHVAEGTSNRGYKYAVIHWDDADKIRKEVKEHLMQQINEIETDKPEHKE